MNNMIAEIEIKCTVNEIWCCLKSKHRFVPQRTSLPGDYIQETVSKLWHRVLFHHVQHLQLKFYLHNPIPTNLCIYISADYFITIIV